MPHPVPRRQNNELNPTMTKSEEIQILRECAAKLGSNSYSGAWLSEQIEFIESAMRSDIEPGAAGLSWNATFAECIAMKSEAVVFAKETRDRAERDAAKRIDEASSRVDRMRDELRQQTYQIQRELDRI